MPFFILGIWGYPAVNFQSNLPCFFPSQIKKLLELGRSVLRASHGVANSPGVLKDLVIVTTLEGLVTKEVHSGIGDTARLLGLALQVLQAVCLVPASGEHVERNLAADAEGEAQVTEALAQLLDKSLANLVLLIEDLVVNALLNAGVPTDRRHVDHAVAELDKGTALDRDVQVGDVVQAERGELLVLVFTNPLDEAVGGEGLAIFF